MSQILKMFNGKRSIYRPFLAVLNYSGYYDDQGLQPNTRSLKETNVRLQDGYA